MAIVIYFFYPDLYNKTHIQSVYGAIRRKLETWLNCHDKFISPENIIIFSVLSDDCTCSN